jgi:hypothetical protein
MSSENSRGMFPRMTRATYVRLMSEHFQSRASVPAGHRNIMGWLTKTHWISGNWNGTEGSTKNPFGFLGSSILILKNTANRPRFQEP